MIKRLFFIVGFLVLIFSWNAVSAQEEEAAPETPAVVKATEAENTSECGTQEKPVRGKLKLLRPENCLYLEEPIGGRPNYDLYVVDCFHKVEGKNVQRAEGCAYNLWGGEAIAPPTRGPIQAILTRPKDQQADTGLALLYNYLGLIYKYVSGIVVGFVVLFIVVGGIQMSTSGGDPGKFDEGKKRIQSALVGLVVWFLASLILYTINPTFFAF